VADGAARQPRNVRWWYTRLIVKSHLREIVFTMVPRGLHPLEVETAVRVVPVSRPP
jgi:hypothetical protein